MTRLTKNYIVLDTETSKGGRVNDIGYVIGDLKTTFISKRFLIAETNAIETPFYTEKIEYYDNLIDNGEVPVVPMEIAINELLNDKEKYHATLFAYNSPFDLNKINETLKFVGSELKIDEIVDIRPMTSNTIINKKYMRFVKENNYISPTGIPQTKAETMYRYLTQNTDFIENHTALSDSIIELEILRAILRKHQKRQYKMTSNKELKAMLNDC